MYGPVDGLSLSSSSSMSGCTAAAPWRTKIFTDDAGTRALGAMRRRIEMMLRWMSSTSVTGEPPLTTLPIHVSSSTSRMRRNSSEPSSKYLRSPGLHCESASRSLLSILVQKNRALLLSSLMVLGAPGGLAKTAPGWAGSGRFGDKDSNLDEQLQRLLSYH